jgi:hypothetical protein
VFNTARPQASAAKLMMARAAFVVLVIVTLTLFTLQDDAQTARSVTFVGAGIRWNIARGHAARLEPWSLAPTPREAGASDRYASHRGVEFCAILRKYPRADCVPLPDNRPELQAREMAPCLQCTIREGDWRGHDT